jgi:hypothetical protein
LLRIFYVGKLEVSMTAGPHPFFEQAESGEIECALDTEATLKTTAALRIHARKQRVGVGQ